MKNILIFSLIFLVAMLCFQYFSLEANTACEAERTAESEAKAEYDKAQKKADELAIKLIKKQAALGGSKSKKADQGAGVARLQQELITARRSALYKYKTWQAADSALLACLTQHTSPGPCGHRYTPNDASSHRSVAFDCATEVSGHYYYLCQSPTQAERERHWYQKLPCNKHYDNLCEASQQHTAPRICPDCGITYYECLNSTCMAGGYH